MFSPFKKYRGWARRRLHVGLCGVLVRGRVGEVQVKDVVAVAILVP